MEEDEVLMFTRSLYNKVICGQFSEALQCLKLLKKSLTKKIKEEIIQKESEEKDAKSQ